MQTEKATTLCDFLNTAIKYFEYAVQQKEKELPNHIRLKNTLTEETFNKMHQEYMNELASNILEYRDFVIAYNYMKNTLNAFSEWDGLGYDVTSQIISNNHDVQFLLKLKLSIEKEARSIRVLFNDYFMHNSRLRNYFNDVISTYEREQRKTKTPEPDKNKPPFDERFDFDKMMTECTAKVQDALSRIGFIQDRLFDFRQWQLKYDIEDALKISFSKDGRKYKYTSEYYPKFEHLCNIELERLEKKHEIDKKILTNKAIEKNPIIIQNQVASPYKWNGSATDFLELIAALHQKNSIVRKDGKKLPRIEIIKYFMDFYNLEIKDVEGMLTRATNRKMNMTPFLDSLKIAFENYGEEKEKKLDSRR